VTIQHAGAGLALRVAARDEELIAIEDTYLD
jgi:hypothetical protein